MQFPRFQRPLVRPVSARQAVRRPAVVAALALALVLAATSFLPERTTPDDSIAPSSETGLTPQMEREIDRVVAAGRTLPQVRATGLSTSASRSRLAGQLSRCADLEGQRYCLGVGWTTRTPAQVARQLARPAVLPGRETTGDLDPLAALARTAGLTASEREAADRAELTEAARAVPKVWELRRDLEGVKVPEHLRDSLPQRRVSRTYPRRSTVMRARHASAQVRTYWCGPATIQMIGNSAGKRRNQAFWSRRLRTTTAGTAITDMVRVINRNTNYDSPERAGRYIVLDISDYTFKQWYRLMMRHVHDYRAPVVLHPVLEKRFFPYLDDDASGHFQVGRGFDKNRGRPLLGFFEPWDQSRFDPSEPFIARVQWRRAYRSYRANHEHFQHNVGV